MSSDWLSIERCTVVFGCRSAALQAEGSPVLVLYLGEKERLQSFRCLETCTARITSKLFHESMIQKRFRDSEPGQRHILAFVAAIITQSAASPLRR